MSKQGTSLANNPKVVAGVLGVLAVVVALNVKAYWPKAAETRSYSSESAPGLAPPPDLLDISRDIDASVRRNPLAAPRGGVQLGAVTRNPFETLRATRVGLSRPTTRRRRTATPERPVCSALFLGGKEASAIVGGHSVAAGDRVGRYRVKRITARGVTLESGGRETFLPLDQKRSGDGAVGAPVAQAR